MHIKLLSCCVCTNTTRFMRATGCHIACAVRCLFFGLLMPASLPITIDYVQTVQDLVTRGGKFIFMYKRCGRRVIVNAGGHMMVAPSRIEAWVQEHTIGKPSALRSALYCSCCCCVHCVALSPAAAESHCWFAKSCIWC